MSRDPQATGLTRRRRRLSDEEIERPMLQAALDMVNSTGLTVSLEHLSFEDVIRAAGVSRSAVQRRWPYKDLFFSDLLKELARGRSPAIATANPEAISAVSRIILDHLDWLKQPGLRPALAAEILRQQAPRELETFHSSAEWRTYIALHATFLSLPDGALRTEVQAALTGSEREFIARSAEAYDRITRLIGCRIRPELGPSFDAVASLASATIRGLVVMAPASPDITTRTIRANPFGAPEPAEWSPPALAMASIILTFIEPDPTVEFDDERITAVRRALTSGDWMTIRD